MLHALAVIAVGILALCFWLIFRPETAEMAAYVGYLDRKQRNLDLRELRRKHRITSDTHYLALPICIAVAVWVIWRLFH